MDLIYKSKRFVRGKGLILIFQREEDKTKHPEVGSLIEVNGRKYRVRGVEFFCNAMNGEVNSDIGVIVKAVE